jgi:hypothetical protein
VTPARADFTGPYEYDGIGAGDGPSALDLRTLYPIAKGPQVPDREASGLTYNPFLWGAPRGRVRAGDTWDVAIPTAWEMGTAGTQHVTVVAVDDANHTVTLQRVGTAAVDVTATHDAASAWPLTPTQRSVNLRAGGSDTKAVLVSSGPYSWRGYTTFRDGVITSDALLSERDVVLQPATGEPLKAHQRMIMLLNAVPNRS